MPETLNHSPSSTLPSIDVACPNCGHQGMSLCYELENVTSHSCILMPTREVATQFPRGDLRIGFCDACGFLSNTAFDGTLQDYTPDYEETQHFSALFDGFAHELAQRLIDDYDIRNKTILEIGCGKAEFLALMCRLGNNHGIGVDPGCHKERIPEDIAPQMTIINDYYSEKYSHLAADVVCCRHTLEHIHPTQDFLQTVRRAIGDRKETLVIFELPDATRVLREPAFWDIYYEHCSYFTTGSLSRLFRDACFDVVEVWRDFDDQYILLVARPTDEPTEARLELEDDLEITRNDVALFSQQCQQRISEWRDRMLQLAADGRRPVVWGSGSKCVSFFTTLGIRDEVEYVVDINPHKHGKFLPGSGHEIVSPEFLKEYQPDAVVVMNPIYCDEIAADLKRLGVDAEIIPV